MDLATLRTKYRAVRPGLTERPRRLGAAAESQALGHGGIALVERAKGISRSTITRGLHEVESVAQETLAPCGPSWIAARAPWALWSPTRPWLASRSGPMPSPAMGTTRFGRTGRNVLKSFISLRTLSSSIGRPRMIERILIAEDHPLMAEGLKEILAGVANSIEVALTVEDAVSSFVREHCNILLLDLSFRGSDLSGFDLLDRLSPLDPDSRIIILSMYDDYWMREEARKRGAMGFVSKSEPKAALLEAIRAVEEGNRWFKSGRSAKRLTARQFRIVRELAVGKSEKEAADILGIAVRTVEFHLATARVSLGARSTGELLTMCSQMGLLLGAGEETDRPGPIQQ